MSKVIVLMDNEKRNSVFVNSQNLNRNQSYSTLCRTLTPAEMADLEKPPYYYEVFGLMTNSPKLDNFITTHDGIILSVDSRNVSNVKNRFKQISERNRDKVLAIVIEHDESSGKFNLNIKQWIQSLLIGSLHKVFVIQTNTPSQLFVTYRPQFDDNTSIQKWIVDNLKSLPKSLPKRPSYVDSEVTSQNINALKLMIDFANQTLPLHVWDHYGRLRVVWCSLMRFGYDKTIDRNGWLCKNWKEYKTSIGHGDKWNYTLTRFWTIILWDLQQEFKYKTFESLYNSNPEIQSGSLFKQYYGNEIFTDYAKENWIKPTKYASSPDILTPSFPLKGSILIDD